MAWSAITADDLETVLTGPELEAYRRKAGASDGSDDDKLQEIVDSVTDEIRGMIEACAANRLGAAGTLPERVHRKALVMMMAAILGRVGSRLSDSRQREVESAERFFIRVAECKFKIEQPDTGDVVDEGNTPEAEVITSQDAEATREQLGGLY